LTDVLTRNQRSYNMSRIRYRDTGPELNVRRLLRRAGVRGYRVNYGIAGKPDLAFVKRKIAVFIDGCFWHRCPVDFKEPQTRKAFWIGKVERNVARDREVGQRLSEEGWTVMRFWEHDIRRDPDRVVSEIVRAVSD
jgi:DNA mismatch endonuclease, patch repair protein